MGWWIYPHSSHEKTVPQSQVLHNSSTYDKSYQLNYLQRFQERSASRDYPPPINAKLLFLWPLRISCQILEQEIYLLLIVSVEMVMIKQRKWWNRNSLQQTTSKLIKREDEKLLCNWYGLIQRKPKHIKVDLFSMIHSKLQRNLRVFFSTFWTLMPNRFSVR